MSDSNETKYEIWIFWIKNSKTDFPKTKSEICDFQNSKTDLKNSESALGMMTYKNSKIQNQNRKSFFKIRFSKYKTWNRNTKFYETKTRKSIFEIRFKKKTKPETEIQKFMKPKIENQFFKIRIRNKKCLERKLENRFAKSDSKKEIWNLNFSESRIRKSIFYKTKSELWDLQNSKTDLKIQNRFWKR